MSILTFFTKKLTKGMVCSLAITLVIAVLLFIVGPTPAQAVTPSVFSAKTSYYIGNTITFTVNVDIHSSEQIPIDNIKVCVTKAGTTTTRWVTFLPSGAEIAESPTNYWTTSLSASTAPYAYCYGYGYGYGWQSDPFAGGVWGYIPCTGYGYMGYMPWKSFGYVQGYGYGYTGYGGGPFPGTVSLQYTVTLLTTGMATGSYNTIVDVDTGVCTTHYLSSPAYTFNLSSLAGGGGGAAAGPDIDPDSINVCDLGIYTAAICWNTGNPGTTQLGYSASPWLFSELDETLVTEHRVELTGLEADTTYKYYCISKDALGNTSKSAIYTFTTLAAEEEEVPPEEEEVPPEEEAAPPEEEAAPPEEEAPAGVNWALIWGIIAAVVVIIVLAVWLPRRKKTA